MGRIKTKVEKEKVIKCNFGFGGYSGRPRYYEEIEK